jgi:hypothetical protein
LKHRDGDGVWIENYVELVCDGLTLPCVMEMREMMAISKSYVENDRRLDNKYCYGQHSSDQLTSLGGNGLK